ncbi:hypothetical protein BUALT_Bualt02G0057300 [Buddleja alternifolia]|uniref:Uncharacterized protein n=1 Tax=Buddleja alternifolia TaxID=168488 RepID=A0AAV6Y201_9LAMI|nr:hypothetical protein BUALT_Bualt02G0057300 [Buddleja alternifolia]
MIAMNKSRSEELNSSTSAVKEFFKSHREIDDEVFYKLKEFDRAVENEEINSDADKGSKGNVEENVSIPGPRRVMHLVKEFQKLSILKLKEVEEMKDDTVTKVSLFAFCPSDFSLTLEHLGLDSHHSYPLHNRQGRYASIDTTQLSRKSPRLGFDDVPSKEPPFLPKNENDKGFKRCAI